MILTNDNLSQFLQPISDQLFAGRYLKLEGHPYRSLRNDFNQAQTALRALTEGGLGNDALTETNTTHWQTLADNLADSLRNDTKDFELLGWFVAAQVVLDPSLHAFALSLTLIHQLVDAHFDELHPTLPVEKCKTTEPDDQQREIASFKLHALLPMAGDSEASGLLFMPLQLAGLVGNVSYFQYQSAERQRRLDTLQADIHQGLAMGKDALRDKLLQLDDALQSTHRLEARLNALASQHQVTAPNFIYLKNQLQGMIRAMEQMTGLRLETLKSKPAEVTNHSPSTIEPEIDAAQDETPEAVVMSNNHDSRNGSGAYTRASAYQELRHIAEFFKRTEPHSPVPYLLEKAIRWGAMPLDDLLTELLTGQPDIKESIFNVTGLDEATHIQPIAVSTPSPITPDSPSLETVDNNKAATSAAHTDHNQTQTKPDGTGNSQLW